jgi:hypothetical protein
MKRFFFLSLLLFAAVCGYAQRTERFEGGDGNYGGGFRYSVNTRRMQFKAFSALAYPDRLGGSVGFGQIGRKERSWMVEAGYYYNLRESKDEAHIVMTAFTHYWTLIKIVSTSRVLFGLSPMMGYQYAKSLKIEGAERHNFVYGFGIRLEYEHLVGNSIGLFVGAEQNVECLTKITQARMRHYIEAGVRVSLGS